MTTPLLTKSFRTGAAAIAGFLILKYGAGGVAEVASAGTDALIGAAGSLGAPANGMVDVTEVGWSEVRLGGNIAWGDPLTSNNAGKAVKAVPVAGSVVRIIGFARADGAADDIAPYLVAHGVLATPA
ncbi:hypothetical protein [Shinella kummerowiae]|uniref:hypothetical protein n=1 Tax=Shinella kummerowiae TaxID=417745 RepID=UPI0021B5608C|nr:hypothetical protein [Shinella kummerowiae]MCT7668211.1 hypothetical protein [Shinella kummerowiae]